MAFKISLSKFSYIYIYNGMKFKTILIVLTVVIFSYLVGNYLNFSGNLSKTYGLDVGKSRDQNPDNIFKKSK